MPSSGEGTVPDALIQYEEFVVGDTPYCFWDLDVRERNLEFLSSIDPSYYFHVADIHSQHLEGDDKLYAATALRMTYSLGLESLFALLCAAVQAPECVVGWVLRYRNEDVPEVVKKIDGRTPGKVLTRLDLDPVTWDGLSEYVFGAFSTGDNERDRVIRSEFARLWKSFANDFLDPKSTAEYNSLKHGLRVQMGGFSMAFGMEATPGVPAPPEAMHPLGGSVFGSTFFLVEPLSTQRDLKHNFQVIRQSLNWNPMKYVHGLTLIGMSIQNVVSFLKVFNGVSPSEVQFAHPSQAAGVEFFRAPWRQAVGGVLSSDFSPRYTIKADDLLTKANVRASYDSGSSNGLGSSPESGEVS
jgi:hypothetical protein